VLTEFGRIEYILRNGSKARKVLLTLIGQCDEDILKREGLRGLRLRRLVRLTREAEEQGSLLSYEDLSALLVTSISTLKRDIAYLERKGIRVPIKGRRKRQRIALSEEAVAGSAQPGAVSEQPGVGNSV
jgi:Fic family protein